MICYVSVLYVSRYVASLSATSPQVIKGKTFQPWRRRCPLMLCAFCEYACNIRVPG